MKQKTKQVCTMLFALLLSVTLIASTFMSFAQSGSFIEKAYTDIVTFSDCQNIGSAAYNNFGKVLKVMYKDGMPEPDALLVGGDYSMLLGDYATPGIMQLREQYTGVYNNGDPDDIICVQGNHDLKISAFYPTGLYDMGTYCLYIINEDQYPWLQYIRKSAADTVKATAQNIKTALDAMIYAGDTRPVIFITHVPLHHTSRSSYGDNLYASYLFSVLNEAAKTLDIIFLFGHNHSGDYDDYIGGSVNFMAPGDRVRIPTPDQKGKDCYTEETLRFTYTNCGYIGFDLNHASETSTNVLSLGAIRFFSDRFLFLKYTDDGLFRKDEVKRINDASESDLRQAAITTNLKRNNDRVWDFEKALFEPFIRFFVKVIRVLFP